ncbi:MAG: hypothetical protein ACYC7A_19380 [Thermoanaerobaculia bacterium]
MSARLGWLDPGDVPPPNGVTVEILRTAGGEPIFGWWDADVQLWRSHHFGKHLVLTTSDVVAWREVL